MDKHRNQPLLLQQQQEELADGRRRKPSLEDDRRRSTTSKKMRLDKEKENANGSTNNNNNDSSNSTSSSLQQGQGSRRRSRSPRAGLDPLASNAYKTPLPNLPPPRSKVVNWRLACFMAREYLSRGTLLGKPWPAQGLSSVPRENITAKSKPPQGEETVGEKERLYAILNTDFLRSDDVQIPGILNPSQLAAWLGFN